MTDPIVEHASLDVALVAAQACMSPVKKDGTNNYSKYKYTTAEGMLAACRLALNDNGLSSVRKSAKIEYREKCKEPLVASLFKLTHGPTKEHELFESEFPIIEKKGTPLDKAHAAALTSSVGYFLRDLLLVVRSDDPTMDRRNDTDHDPQKIKQNQKQNQKQEPPKQIKMALHRRWPEIKEKYTPLLKLVNMTIEQLAELNVNDFVKLKMKIEELQTEKGG